MHFKFEFWGEQSVMKYMEQISCKTIKNGIIEDIISKEKEMTTYHPLWWDKCSCDIRVSQIFIIWYTFWCSIQPKKTLKQLWIYSYSFISVIIDTSAKLFVYYFQNVLLLWTCFVFVFVPKQCDWIFYTSAIQVQRRFTIFKMKWFQNP